MDNIIFVSRESENIDHLHLHIFFLWSSCFDLQKTEHYGNLLEAIGN